MKKLLFTMSLVAATASPVLAETSNARIEDHFKTVLEQTPYNVEVCRDVKVPVYEKGGKELDTEGAIIGGIIGGVIGNQFGKGNGKEAMTGVGALTGAIIGGSKDRNGSKPQYHWERQCSVETRYKETEKEVYSHSTVTFWSEGQKRTLKFYK